MGETCPFGSLNLFLRISLIALLECLFNLFQFFSFWFGRKEGGTNELLRCVHVGFGIIFGSPFLELTKEPEASFFSSCCCCGVKE